jgi:hypothetical protein
MTPAVDTSIFEKRMRHNVGRHAFAPLLGCALLLACVPSFANDSIGSVAAGGISFQKSESIRLLSEELYISSGKIRVGYRFLNESPKDIHATVLFPMPPYGWNSGEYVGAANERPLEGFSVKVDGKAVATRLDKRAITDSQDVTDRLRAIGLSDAQMFQTFATCQDENFCGVSDEQKHELEQVGPWKVAETAVWEQDFPAHRNIEVRHEYFPFT